MGRTQSPYGRGTDMRGLGTSVLKPTVSVMNFFVYQINAPDLGGLRECPCQMKEQYPVQEKLHTIQIQDNENLHNVLVREAQAIE